MKPNLTLSIARPCDEKWQNFKQTAQGGYCGACEKTVVDFTGMTDERIIEYFKNKPGHVCGRFRPEQLKSYTTLPLARINPGFTLLKAGLLSLLFMLLAKQSSAQQVQKPRIENSPVTSDSLSISNLSVDGEQRVTGFVKDRKDPFPGVNIWLKGSEKGTTTDADGYFQFPVPLRGGDVLVFSFIGYASREYKIPTKTTGHLQIPIELAMTCEVTLGEVVATTPYKTRSGLRQWWSKVRGQ